jgi:hypothetical protein
MEEMKTCLFFIMKERINFFSLLQTFYNFLRIRQYSCLSSSSELTFKWELRFFSSSFRLEYLFGDSKYFSWCKFMIAIERKKITIQDLQIFKSLFLQFLMSLSCFFCNHSHYHTLIMTFWSTILFRMHFYGRN